ncbi:hypothetical protein EK21DRAFT_114353 [Setomelanomma holmii]|uniref:Protein kinase domain-containing protein n=1 Tax=Setomelanomma holmii TaxID=210430 RepID=A0A9P4H449_9PLEO|nr:hypothetical protein EK21DRAFT_114353 [Setomelanomma holmii]
MSQLDLIDLSSLKPAKPARQAGWIVVLGKRGEEEAQNIGYTRFVGTSFWTPLERFCPGGEDGPLLKAYAPRNWRVSIKSDIYAVGLIGYFLMAPHVYSILELQQHMSWEGGWHQHDGPVNFVTRDFPSGYSIDLPNTILECMRYHPDSRPNLDSLQTRIQEDLDRLDKLYGDRIRQNEDHMPQKLRPRLKRESDDAFALRKAYSSAKKRRAVSEEHFRESEDADKYRKHVEKWNDLSEFPRPTKEEQVEFLQTLDSFVMGTEDEPSPYTEELHDRYTWQHLISTLKKRVDPNLPVYQITNIESDFVATAFRQAAKENVLGLLLDMINGLPAPTTAVIAFAHAAKWALHLLAWEGIPEKPKLQDKTDMYRGLRDYVFHVPTGAFYHPPPPTGEKHDGGHD